ncbi:MAG TPA: hypothetical protein VGK87_04445 [Anaerolineae bacterium]
MRKASKLNAQWVKKRRGLNVDGTPEAARTISSEYQASYRETGYRRSFFFRLTALSRFMLVLAILALAGVISLVATHLVDSTNGTERLSDRLPMQPEVVIYDQLTPTPSRKQRPTLAPTSAIQPTALPTLDPSKAPWVDQLTRQADGTLIAPREVVMKAAADIGAYYSLQRDMPLDDYIAKRNELLKTYFTGRALEYMRGQQTASHFYEMNRGGRFSVEIRRFGDDGLTATAGVIRRDWVSDIYDLATGRLEAHGKVSNDTLTLMTVSFDRTDGRWKFASIDEVMELTP